MFQERSFFINVNRAGCFYTIFKAIAQISLVCFEFDDKVATLFPDFIFNCFLERHGVCRNYTPVFVRCASHGFSVNTNDVSCITKTGHYYKHDNILKFMLIIAFACPSVFRDCGYKLSQMTHDAFPGKAKVFLFKMNDKKKHLKRCFRIAVCEFKAFLQKKQTADVILNEKAAR